MVLRADRLSKLEINYPPPPVLQAVHSHFLCPLNNKALEKTIIKAKIAYIRFTVSAGVEVWSVTDDNLYVEG